jgi:hypothetical protein
MGQLNNEIIQDVSDLIQINFEVAEFYKVAAFKTPEMELKTLFSDGTELALKHKFDLARLLYLTGCEADSVYDKGHIYSYWTGYKPDRELPANHLLQSCTKAEQTISLCYQIAIKRQTNKMVKEMFQSQFDTIQQLNGMLNHYNTLKLTAA